MCSLVREILPELVNQVVYLISSDESEQEEVALSWFQHELL